MTSSPVQSTHRLTADDLHPQLRGLIRIPNPPIRYGWQRGLLRLGIRLMPSPKPVEGVAVRTVEVPGGKRVHVFTPDTHTSAAALIWIHGGGMVLGSPAQDHDRCVAVAIELGIVVVSVEYRLAPEHPFPTPLNDCQAAWNWTLAHADQLGVDPARIAIGGQSAGGGLAAALALRLHDEGGQQPVAQWLFCPMLDDRTALDRTRDGLRHPAWNNVSNRIAWGAYLGREPGLEVVPEYAAPARRENLSGLCPAWVGTGDIELFYDEDRTYAERLTAAGVACELDVVSGAPHAFESFAGKMQVAQNYMSRATEWLREQLGD